MSNKSLTQLQQEFKDQKYEQALKLSKQIIENEPQNRPTAIIFEINSLIKLSDYKSALTSAVSSEQILIKEAADDKFTFQLYNAAIEASNLALEIGNQKDKKEALEHKIQYTKKLLNFLERKERYDKFQEKLQELVNILTPEDRYSEIEQIYVQVLENPKFSDEFRHQCGIGVFTMSQFHKPKLVLTIDLFNKIKTLNPESPGNQVLSQQLLKDFDKQIDLDTKKQGFSPKDFLKTCKDFNELASAIFMNMNLSDDSVTQNLLAKQLSLFYKFVMISINLYNVCSPDYQKLIEKLRELSQSSAFTFYYESQEDTSLKLPSLIQGLLQLDDNLNSLYLKNANFDNKSEEWQLKELSNLRKIVDQNFSPIGELMITKNLDLDNAYLVLNQGLSLIKNNLDLGFAQQYDFTKIINKLENLQQNSINQDIQQQKRYDFSNLINENLIKLKYQYYLSIDDWKAAKQILDEIDQSGDNKVHPDWIKSQRAWLSYSSLDELENEEDKLQIIKGQIVLLKEALQINPKNIEAQIRLGTMYFNYEKQLGLNAKSDQIQWIQALKQDPQNGEIYLCLGIYFYAKENDMNKAMKSLMKAIELRADLEDAQFLLFLILVELGKTDEAFANLAKFQKISPYSVVPQFYLGLNSQNHGQYQKATEYFQRAIRNHQYQQSIVKREKSSYPTIKDCSILTRYSNPLQNQLNREISLVSKNDLIFWIHLADCHLKQDKAETGYKCITKLHKDLKPILENHKKINILEDAQIINNEQNQKLKEILKPIVDSLILPEAFNANYQLISTIFNEDLVDTFQHDLQFILLVTSQAFYKFENYHNALKIVSLALDNINTYTQGTQQEILVNILENLNKLIDIKARGQLDSQGILKQKCLKCLVGIFKLIDEYDLTNDIRLINVKVDSLKILSELLNEKEYLIKAIDLLQNSLTDNNQINQSNAYTWNAKLNLAKLYHSLLINFSDDSQYENKIQLIRELLRSQTLNSQYWTYYGIFDQNALNNLFALLLRGNYYKKAIEVMNKLKGIQPLNPVLMAIQIIFKARLVLSKESITTNNHDARIQQLQQTISLGQMYIEIEKERSDIADKERNPKLDIYGYFSDQIQHLILLMQYEVEDAQLNYYDFIDVLDRQIQQTHQYESLIKCIKAKSQIITQGKSTVQKLKDICEQCLSQNDSLNGQLDKIRLIFKEFENEDTDNLLTQHSQTVLNLLQSPSNQVATRLILLNLRMIKSQINPKINLIEDENEEQLDHALSKVEHKIAAQLLISVFQQAFNMNPSNIIALQDKFYLFDWYKIELEGHLLQRPEYGKIFKLYLFNQSEMHRDIFIKEYKRLQLAQFTQIKDLIARIKVKSEINMSNQVEIMNKPTSLKGYNKLIWHQFKTGDLELITKVIELTNNKIKVGIINEISENDKLLFDDYQTLALVLQQGSLSIPKQFQSFNENLRTIINLFLSSIDQAKQSQDDKSAAIKKLIKDIIIVLINSPDQLIEEELAIIYENLQTLLLNRGYLQTFNDFGTEFLSSLKEQQNGSIHPLFQNEINLQFSLNMSNNYLNLKKLGQANAMKKQVNESFQINKSMNNDSKNMLEALMKLKAKQPLEAIKQLDLVESLGIYYEKEFLTAQALYDSKVIYIYTVIFIQQYKNYYLQCKTLVSTLKEEISLLGQDNPNSAELIIDSRRFNFFLGYAYYLKAQAESTFMQARCQGIRLEDDFDEEDEKVMDVDYLHDKAKNSFEKCKWILQDYEEIIAFVDKELEQFE
ncbi:tetratricopeptide repeat-containing protein [Stylonychia lemnae]|uniref:Tetratricopeptide repeat-containing protein n=1 Tax=Stylonychia lemnae TaxID=5949 RepID=A0A078B8K4_STYLE|nr:tetratricopeptide repeat-containing protein [Stylonychia lemnae]|eukprot:CDW90850.1 tetratricopeptide repeat-containing protein [Stylonychia lemnae]